MSRERIRSLKPEFFRDEKIKLLSRDARLVAIGLITRSDDRGRQARELQAILGHVFPGGDVTSKQLERWVGDIVTTGFALAYDEGPFAYLWLPNFWKHQVINKPTESSYPAHPEDPYAQLPVKEAIRAYRQEQDPEELPELVPDVVRLPRPSARSVPFQEVGEALQGVGEIDARELCPEPPSKPQGSPSSYAVQAALLTWRAENDIYRQRLIAFAGVHFPGKEPDLVAHCAMLLRRCGGDMPPTVDNLRDLVAADGVLRPRRLTSSGAHANA